jgi:hypothetical protein
MDSYQEFLSKLESVSLNVALLNIKASGVMTPSLKSFFMISAQSVRKNPEKIIILTFAFGYK